MNISDIYKMQIEALDDKEKEIGKELETVFGSDGGFSFDSQNPFGIVILSGGQGTRLGVDLPKGCFELEKGRSLFSILVSKIRKKNAYLAVMTAEDNHQTVLEFFEKNNYFGLNKSNLDFFTQENWPVLSLDRQLVKKDENHFLTSPIGNGSFYSAFMKSSILPKWQNLGVTCINILPIDNILADPQDENLLGAINQGYDLAIRGIQGNIGEKVGKIFKKNNKVHIIEYSSKQPEENTLAYSGLFAISMKFLLQAAALDLPIYPVYKKGKVLLQNEIKEVDIIKFERFIFDVFHIAENNIVLNTCRKKYFCPLKDKLGPYGVESVRQTYKEVLV